MFGSATGTVDADFDADWIVDGNPGRPVSAAAGLSLNVTAPASRTVSILSIINHNISGSVGITGGVTATIPAATLNKDDIYLNPWVQISPVSASTLTLTAAGTPAVIGELFAGKLRMLERQLLTEPEFDLSDPFEWEGSAMPPYDPGISDTRRLVGETIVTGTGLADIHAWYQSTRRGTRPSLIVPIDTVNDAWLVTFNYTWRPVYILQGSPEVSLHRVAFEFVEIPRVRW